jgi:hypothetical protein
MTWLTVTEYLFLLAIVLSVRILIIPLVSSNSSDIVVFYVFLFISKNLFKSIIVGATFLVRYMFNMAYVYKQLHIC